MTSQQHADILLRRWQALRPLAPEERIQRLIDDFFSPLPPTEIEFDLTLDRVREEMAA